MIYFTADLHLGHRAVINNNFDDEALEMEETLDDFIISKDENPFDLDTRMDPRFQNQHIPWETCCDQNSPQNPWNVSILTQEQSLLHLQGKPGL